MSNDSNSKIKWKIGAFNGSYWFWILRSPILDHNTIFIKDEVGVIYDNYLGISDRRSQSFKVFGVPLVFKI